MKKRRIKKSVLFVILILVLLTVSYIVLSRSDSKKEENNSEKPIEEVDTSKRMSLIAVGDVLIHESVYKDAYENGTYKFHKMFTEIEPILKKYDLKYCNMESTIGGKNLGISGYPSFNSPDEIGDEIVDLGFNLISLANNHALDKGESAVLYSNNFWKGKDVITAGAYSSSEERNQTVVYEQNGIKYAFFAYTEMSNGKVPNDYLINIYSDEKAKKDIEEVKDLVDVIIVSMHWGEEYTNEPTYNEKRIAKYLSDLGVNLIIGSHPHVVQPVGYVGNTLVIYSLGNFISNQLSIAENYPSDANPGIGLMVGMDIKVDNGEVTFENLYEELILAYAENSTNFKVIPFSNLNDTLLNNYKEIQKTYMNIVTREVNYD